MLARIMCTFIVALLLSVLGCDDQGATGPTTPTEDRVTGFIVLKNGVDVVEVQNGVAWGEVTVAKNADDVFELVFMDANGEGLDLSKSKCTLGWQCDASGCVLVDRCSDDLEKWQFHIHGTKNGCDCFKMKMLNDTYDLLGCPAIKVTVTD